MQDYERMDPREAWGGYDVPPPAPPDDVTDELTVITMADEERRLLRIGRYAFCWAASHNADWYKVIGAIDGAINSNTPWSNAAMLALYYGMTMEQIQAKFEFDPGQLAEYERDMYLAIGRAFPDGFQGYRG